MPHVYSKTSFKSLGNTLPTFPNWDVSAKVIAVLIKARESQNHIESIVNHATLVRKALR